jgi:hypothetical protein
MKFHRILVSITLAAMLAFPTASAIAIGLGGRGGVNSGNVEMGEPSRLQQVLVPPNQTGLIGPSPALTARRLENVNTDINAEPPLLSAEPVSSVISTIENVKRPDILREPVRTYNANSIDSEGNIYFSPGTRSSRIRD